MSRPVIPAPRQDLLDRIDRCLNQFNARKVDNIEDAYEYIPDITKAKIGSGSYGQTFRMKNKAFSKEPARIVKFIEKSRIAINELQVQHLCVELAVLKLVHHQNLNHGTDLLYNQTHIFMVLELCEGATPSLETRLYHLFSRAHPARMAEVPAIVESFQKEMSASGRNPQEIADEEDALLASESSNCGKKEIPMTSDLFNCIVANSRLHPLKASIITKGVLQGLAHLHEKNIVHRDMKTENIVLGETRTSTAITDAEGKLIGVKFTEKIDVKVIDFGLVKYMNMSTFPTTPSPGCFGGSDDPFARAASDVFDNTPSSAGSILIHPTPGLVDCTPCGTEIYCALEVLDGIVGNGFGRRKWQTTKEQLPKFDVYGTGTALYCMINGRPPFRASPQARTATREDRLKNIRQQVQFGPAYWSSTCPADMKMFTISLMQNDVRSRPSANQALRNPILSTVGDTFSYEVLLDGTIQNASAAPQTASSSAAARSAPIRAGAASATSASAPTSGTIAAEDVTISTSATASSNPDEEDSVSDLELEKKEIDDIMAAIRGQEDDGDDSGKCNPAVNEQ